MAWCEVLYGGWAYIDHVIRCKTMVLFVHYWKEVIFSFGLVKVPIPAHDRACYDLFSLKHHYRSVQTLFELLRVRFWWSIIYNITIFYDWANKKCIYVVSRQFRGSLVCIAVSMPTDLIAFLQVRSIWSSQVPFELKVTPRCLWVSTFSIFLPSKTQLTRIF